MYDEKKFFVSDDEKERYRIIDIKNLALLLGIPTDRFGKCSCPSCGSGTGEKGTSALTERDDNSMYCNKCKKNYDTIELVKQHNNLDFEGVIQWFRENHGYNGSTTQVQTVKIAETRPQGAQKQVTKPKPININEIAGKELEPDVIAYMLSRHIIPEKVEGIVWNLKPDHYLYKKGYKLVIPELKNEMTTFYKMRNIDVNNPDKIRNPKGTDIKQLIGLSDINKMVKKVLITEGEIDRLIALSYLDRSEYNIIASPDAGYTLNNNECRILRDYEVIILFDSDEDGKKGSDSLNNQLNLQYKYQYPEGIKDAGELAEHHKGNEARIRNALLSIIDRCSGIDVSLDAIYSNLVINLRKAQEDGKDRADKNIISTGFKELDDIIQDGFRAGVYGLSARPGAGKTTFLLALAIAISIQGSKVLFISLEMSKKELSSTLLGWSAGVNRLNILDNSVNPDELQKIDQALKSNSSILGNIIVDDNYRNITDIENRVLEIKKKYPKTIVFIDYLQQIQGVGTQKDERLILKDISYKLKDLATQNNIPIFIISSISRSFYGNSKDKKNMDPLTAWKESGDIEYSLYAGFYLDNLSNEEIEANEVVLKSIGNEIGESWTYEKALKLQLVKNRWGVTTDQNGDYISFIFKLNMLTGEIICQ